ncbi:hypothetical protein [Clostridium beijerinckii]|uniref:hypothetical protein n=1 Tax=Clostridium beijerinckii TaxID=1520 RepID=UPI001F3E56D5|nr:hypothetical protein [Clostridium beijerinckii]
MKKEEILLKIPRNIRKGNGSLTIALPKETYQLLNAPESQEVNVVIYQNGKIEIQEGDK